MLANFVASLFVFISISFRTSIARYDRDPISIMLFFKRYLEKSQLTAKQFESAQVPCYFKMRELPAPRRIDHCRDLIKENSSLRYLPYTEDWIVDEYFVDHDSDYLVSTPPVAPMSHSPSVVLCFLYPISKTISRQVTYLSLCLVKGGARGLSLVIRHLLNQSE